MSCARWNSWDEASQTVFQQVDTVSIHQNDPTATEAKVCQRLRIVHWQNTLDRLEVDNDFLLDDDIRIVPAVEVDVLTD
jgi:hypothetical protein